MSAGRLRNRSREAVFLGYHSVAEEGPPFLSVTPEAFERHLALLKRRGFRSGTLADLAHVAGGGRPDGKLAFLTFDDGYVDNYATARPLLEAYGFRAIVFLVPPLIDGGGPLVWERVERHVRDYPAVMRAMTWTMVESMAAEGHEFGSHTLTHPRLPDLDDERLRRELSESREQVERRLGSCEALAYPFGLWSPRVAAATGRAGYSYAFTLPYGAQTHADRLTIPRIAIDHRDDERRFGLKLTRAYRAFALSRGKPALRRLLRRAPAHQSPA
ncbi:MAG TPA: polysaccharide deacetylase family protein [Thermoleophilaceae bacterium]|nr:polysaccharide deacetylase family protein [Thermoleophilaceae bacterium]